MHMTRLIKPLLLTAAWLATGGATQPPPPPAPSDAAGETVNLGEDHNERMTVPVSIGGKGPYRFVVDTGAERTVISRELAGELGLDPGGSVHVHSMTEEGPVDTVIIPTLGISAGSVKDIKAPALARVHLGAAGMLGIDSLEKKSVLLDFKQQTMAIMPSSKFLPRRDPDEIIVTAKSRYGQLILADAEANGHKVAVIIDTGSQVSIGNEALRRKVLGKKPKKPQNEVELLSVTGGRMIAEYTKIRTIRIGGVTLSDMPVAFADVHPFKRLGLTDRPALMLGMNGLRAFDRVAVDFANRKVRFLIPEGAGRDGNTLLALQGRLRPGS